MSAHAIFDQRKAKILAELDSDQRDLSPKGRPDDQILELLHVLNSHQNYVSTSSCSGRAVVYLDPEKGGGNGDEAKGKWLMNSHSCLSPHLLHSPSEGEIYALLFGDSKVGKLWDSTEKASRLITLKFEPLVRRTHVAALNNLDHSCLMSRYSLCL